MVILLTAIAHPSAGRVEGLRLPDVQANDRYDPGNFFRPGISQSTRRFEDYPAIRKFTRKPATPVLTSQRARRYRTMIQGDVRSGPNFAGDYTIAMWGCGSTCVGFAVIDAFTGRVYFHPLVLQAMQVAYQAEGVLQFRPDSRLLIISGEILSEGSGDSKGVGKYYYEWKNNRFRLIERVEVKREEGAPPLQSYPDS